jgi:hypothetical protein
MRSIFFAVTVAALLASYLFLTGCGGGTSAMTNHIVPPPVSDCAGGTSDVKRPAVPRSVPTPDSGAVPATYFGLNPHPKLFGFGGNLPWPTSNAGFNFGSERLWATETTWNDLNCPTCTTPGSGAGVYDFTNLDTVLTTSINNGQTDFIYTFGVVPPWASSNPTDQTCVTNNSPAGSCDPPIDVDTTDADWKNFVTAITAHNKSLGYPIHTWEVWNEPNILTEWNGTPAQMARMAQDAYTIIKASDPTAMVTTPTPGNDGTGQNIKSWELPYLSAVAALSPGNPLADIVTFHGYADVSQGTQPESESNNLRDLNVAISQSPFPSLANSPLWNTEGSWNNDVDSSGAPLDPGTEAAYVARLYLLQWPLGIARFYWFQYGNDQNGTLTSGSGLNEAGVAYGQVYDWMVGNTSTGCTNSGSIYTCGFSNGSEAVWDTSQTCSNGTCTTSTYSPSATYTKCTDLAGNSATISSGNSVTVGARPILLEQ